MADKPVPPAASEERGWLIEKMIDGYGPQWLGNAHGIWTWLRDSNAALRFARRVDADTFCTVNDIDDADSITEHAWGLLPAAADPEAGAREDELLDWFCGPEGYLSPDERNEPEVLELKRRIQAAINLQVGAAYEAACTAVDDYSHMNTRTAERCKDAIRALAPVHASQALVEREREMIELGVIVVPKRIQRKRSRGWKMPAGAVYVGRPTMWGNRWKIGVHSNLIGGKIETREQAVRCYRELGNDTEFMREMVREKLRGKDLVCWCPLDQPCHADVLLEIANG